MVKQHQLAYMRRLAQLNPHDIARMAPIGLDRNGVGERIHGVENNHIGMVEKPDEAGAFRFVLDSVLGVGCIDQPLAGAFEFPAVGVAGVALQMGRDLCAVDVHRLARSHDVEFDLGRKVVEAYRKRRLGLLAAQRELHMRVAAMDHDPVARDIYRGKKRQAHDVVPVQMGHEHMVGLWRAGAKTFEHALTQWTHTGAQVENKVLGAAGIDLHTAGVAAKGPGHIEAQTIHISLHGALRIEAEPACTPQRGKYPGPNIRRRERYRNRPSRAPEFDLHGTCQLAATSAAAAAISGNTLSTRLKWLT